MLRVIMMPARLAGIYILFFCGCQNPKDSINHIKIIEPVEADLNYSLEIMDTVLIPVDSLTRTVNNVNYFYCSPKTELYFDYNPAVHAIQGYNINSKVKEFYIELNKEGPEAIEEVIGLCVVSLDSIFLVTESPKRRILLLNSQGEVLSNWFIQEPLPSGLSEYDLYFSNNFEIEYNNERKSLILSIAVYVEPWKLEYYNHPFIIEYSLSKNKILEQYGVFPYSNDIYFMMEENSRFSMKDKEVVSFYGSDLFLVYNSGDKKLEKIIKVSSKFLNDEIPPIGKDIVEDQDMAAQSNYFLENGSYMVARYDSKRNIIYRLIKTPMDAFNVDGSKKGYSDIEYSLMILDNNFSPIDEIKLSSKKFNPNIFFVNEQGLWLSLNNSSNTSVDEDYLSLVLFRPVSNDKND
ncbi:DUF4221 domain-containing protein [Fulvivirga maritima]|uniref:DUF4221 family protein n=1 Tax=Fulvivirga maritima TaxID=2904247 RepID=UPI001F37DB99|nr:DUF4221 family protein [Fulvivirga maritima]UII28638.1 DUF4221 domain-containing protein [Fulvivirga maritima]